MYNSRAQNFGMKMPELNPLQSASLKIRRKYMKQVYDFLKKAGTYHPNASPSKIIAE